jgi:hypothetical protein
VNDLEPQDLELRDRKRRPTSRKKPIIELLIPKSSAPIIVPYVSGVDNLRADPDSIDVLADGGRPWW